MWLNYCCSMCWFSSLNSSCIIRNEGPIIVLWYILYIHIISGQWPHKLDDSEPEASSPIQRSLECFIEPCLLVFWWPHFLLLARFVPALAIHGAACATDKSSGKSQRPSLLSFRLFFLFEETGGQPATVSGQGPTSSTGKVHKVLLRVFTESFRFLMITLPE